MIAALVFLLVFGGATAVSWGALSRLGRPGMAIALALVAGVFFGSLGWAGMKGREAEARRGWNLIPVVVAAVDVEAGTVVMFDHISQRSIPEQFVDSAMVKPEKASYVVNTRTLVPLAAGQPLYFSYFGHDLDPALCR